MNSTDVISLADLLPKAGCSRDALRIRIQKLDQKIGGGLIVRFGSGKRARIYLDKVKVRQLLPGYLEEREDDPVLVDKVDAIYSAIQRIQEDMVLLLDMTAGTVRTPR